MGFKVFRARLRLYFWLVFKRKSTAIIVLKITDSDQKKFMSGEEAEFNMYYLDTDQRVVEIVKEKLQRCQNGTIKEQ